MNKLGGSTTRVVAASLLFLTLALSGCMQAGGVDGSEASAPPLAVMGPPADQGIPPGGADTNPSDSEPVTVEEAATLSDSAPPESEESADPGSEPSNAGDKEPDETPEPEPTDSPEGPEGTAPEPPSPPAIRDTITTVQGNKVWVNYTIQHATASWVEWGPDTPTLRVNATPGGGTKSILFELEYGTGYVYRIGAEGAGGALQSHDSSVTTGAWPYSWATGEKILIQPGILINLENSGMCTLGFILTSPDNATLYALTAGHCAETGVGGTATAPRAGVTFGKIVHLRNDYISDHALIQIDPAFRQNVSPSMIHWTGPSGLPESGEIVRGDTFCFFGQSADLRWGKSHSSCGPSDGFGEWKFNGWTSQQVLFRAEANGGDSGSPVIDHNSGKAVGILRGHENESGQLNLHATSICNILRLLVDDGFHLRLATSAYTPPPPTQPPAHASTAPQSIGADSDEMIGCANSFT